MQRLLDVLARTVSHRPGATVVAILLLTVGMAGLATQTVQQNDFATFATGGEVATTQDRIAELFGAEERTSTPAQLIIEAADGDVMDAAGVQLAARARQAILDTPAVADGLAPAEDPEQPAVFTFADVVLGAAAEQGIAVEDLTDEVVDQLLVGALGELPPEQSQFIGALLGGDVSDDLTSATHGLVVAQLAADGSFGPASEAAIAFIELDSTADGGIEPVDVGDEVYAFEPTALSEQSNDELIAQIGTLFGLAFLLIIVILVLVYRSGIDVITSVLGLVITIVWSQGLMAAVGPKVLDVAGGSNQIATIIPILLIGLGVDYAIHLTMRSREEMATAGVGLADSTERAIKGVGAALLLATVTTVVGFLTNLINPVPPLQDFGVFAALGVVAAFVVMTTFTPALRLLARRGWARLRRRADDPALIPAGTHVEAGDEPSTSAEPDVLGRIAAAFTPIAVHRSSAVVGVVAVLAAAGGFGFTQLSTEFSQTEFFPSDSRAFATFEVIIDAYGAGLGEQTNVLVDGDVSTADGFNAALAFQSGLAEVPGVRTFEGQAQVDSFLSRLAMTGAELVPVTDDAEAEALVSGLVAADPTAGRVIADGGSAAVFRIQTNVGEQTEPLVEGLRELRADTVGAAGLATGVASEQLYLDEILTSLSASQTTGLVVTLLASAVILGLAFHFRSRQWLLGLIAILAVAVVALWAFGLMALLGIPFNLLTAMTSALAIGIGVPFGIHVVNRFTEDLERHDDLASAMRSTLENTGGALLGSGVTTVAGFGLLILATISPMRDFGTVTAMTIALALVSSLTFLPAMLAIWARRQS